MLNVSIIRMFVKKKKTTAAESLYPINAWILFNLQILLLLLLSSLNCFKISIVESYNFMYKYCDIK